MECISIRRLDHSGTESRTRLNTQRQPASSPSISFDFYEATVTRRRIWALREPAPQEKGAVISWPIAAFMLTVTRDKLRFLVEASEIARDLEHKCSFHAWATNTHLLQSPVMLTWQLLHPSRNSYFLVPSLTFFSPFDVAVAVHTNLCPRSERCLCASELSPKAIPSTCFSDSSIQGDDCLMNSSVWQTIAQRVRKMSKISRRWNQRVWRCKPGCILARFICETQYFFQKNLTSMWV